LLPFAAYFGDIMQVALAALATALMVVSINAYRRRSEGRYLVLALAFICLCAVSVSTLALELYVGAGPAIVQAVELYLIPSLELLMVVSFLMSLLWTPPFKRYLRVVFPVIVIVLGLVVLTVYASNSATGSGLQSPLPAGCVKPAGGFLIIANSLGYNDSLSHGAPAQSWPILDIADGSNVTITICNTYQQTVGFQVVHYLQGKMETVQPGHTLTLSFVADEKGTFVIYCAIFCAIHLYLQGGELRVS
jgi:hypothetical protein